MDLKGRNGDGGVPICTRPAILNFAWRDPRKTTKNSCEDSKSRGKELNVAPPERIYLQKFKHHDVGYRTCSKQKFKILLIYLFTM
jgi:hypothetical protein